MNPHTLAVLEFDKVRQLLLACTTTDTGAERAASLVPMTDETAVHEAHRIVAELQDLAAVAGLADLDAPDARLLIERARVPGALLAGVELADISCMLVNAHRARTHFGQAREGASTTWRRRLDTAPSTGELAPHFDRCLDKGGEVKDSATPELGRIRRELARARQSVQRHLEHVASSLSGGGTAAYVTVRNGRFVVPVRTEDRSRVPGIVHDRSSTHATMFIEPATAMPLNDALEELVAREGEEVTRILGALTDEVRDHSDALLALQDLLAALDLDQARVRLAQQLGATRPGIGGDTLRLRAARHPLLVVAKGREAVMPLSAELDADTRVLLITGPNAGGKTVALKTVGLLCCMVQSGLFVPADEGSIFPVFRTVLADIGDFQSLEASLSTFTAHVARLREIEAEHGLDVLVLLDEVGGATDPDEGAALGMATLEELLDRHVHAVMTTHIGSLQAFGFGQPGVFLGSMGFDIERGEPSYRLIPGPGGGSYALAVAARAGLSATWIARAEAHLDPDTAATRRMLGEVGRLVEETERDRAAAAQARRDAMEQLARARDDRAAAQAEVSRAKREARDVVRNEVSRARQRVRAAEEELKAATTKSALRKVERLVDQVEDDVAAHVAPAEPTLPTLPPHLVVRGATVWVRAMNRTGILVDGPDGSGRVQVQAGVFRAWLAPESLAVPPSQAGSPRLTPGSAPGSESRSAPQSAPKKAAAGTAKRLVEERRREEQDGAPDAPMPYDATLAAAFATRSRDDEDELPSPGTPTLSDVLGYRPPDAARGGGGWSREESAAAALLEVDVRGCRADEAVAEVDRFLDRAQLDNVPRVRIIHGKGTGALRAAITRMLKTHGGVRSFGQAAQWDGGAGATTVDLL